MTLHPRGGTTPVLPWLLGQPSLHPDVRALLRSRTSAARAHDGRDAREGQLAVAVEGLLLAAQDVIEAHHREPEGLPHAWERLWTWERVVRVVAVVA